MPDILNLPLEDRNGHSSKAILGEALTIDCLDHPEDKRVCVVSTSQFTGSGFFTGVYTTWMYCPPSSQVNKPFKVSMK